MSSQINKWLLSLALLGLGCLSNCSSLPEPQLVGVAKEQRSSKQSAEQLMAENIYQQAFKSLCTGDYPEAVQGFTEIKVKYLYTSLAALADLRLADVYFLREQYLEAIEAYRNFLKYYPRHSEAPYALFKIAAAYMEQIPGDWWFLPASREKDQAYTKQAVATYEELFAEYGEELRLKPKFLEKTLGDGQFTLNLLTLAQEQWRLARSKLADHELYVVNFYFKQQEYTAALQRIDYLLNHYQDLTSYVQVALGIAAEIRYARKEKAELQKVVEKLQTLGGKESAQLQMARSLAAKLRAEKL